MKKDQTRREFIEKGFKLGLMLPFLGSSPSLDSTKRETEAERDERAGKRLNILILGGTSFIGPHQIAYALKRGHSVTTFTRGKTQPVIYQDLFKDVAQLFGDRESDLSALENKTWDAVIDNSGQRTKWTERSANLLRDSVDLYLYTSSTGVYYPYLGENIKENTELLLKEPEGIEDEEMKIEYWYGVMKATSEMEAQKAFGEDRTIIVRPTYMIGPADKSNRFIHWPVRLARGGEVLVPGKKNDPVQYIDVRDVAEWMIRLIEQKKGGTYNAVGPRRTQNTYAFVKEAAKAFEVNSDFVYIDDYEFLKKNRVPDLVPWIMPAGNNYGSARIDNEKGIKAGLKFRKLPKTVKDTYDWWYSDSLTDEQRNKFELDPKTVLGREKAIIEAWRNHRKS